MHTFVLLGQGGRLTSQGMVNLASRISKFSQVSIHSWNDPEVVYRVNNVGGWIAIVGYSLGANQLGYISHYAKRNINLGIAYDPSRYSPLTKPDLSGVAFQTANSFKRLICYQNIGAWFFGGSYYAGNNVELHKISAFHLGIQFNEALHQRTLKAIEGL